MSELDGASFGTQHAYFSRLVREAEAERAAAAAEIADVEGELREALDNVERLREKRSELQEKSEGRLRYLLQPVVAWLETDPTIAELKRHHLTVGGVRFSWRVQQATQKYEVARGADGQEDWGPVLESAPWATRLVPDRSALRKRAQIVDGAVVDTETGSVINGLVVVTSQASVSYTADIGGATIKLGEGVCSDDDGDRED